MRVVPAALAPLAIAGALLVGARHPSAPPRVALIGGVPLQQARCEQWMGAPRSQQRAVIDALAGTVGGPSSSGGVGTTLTRDEAQALFDHACASSVARGFLLYELYIRAAGFHAVPDTPHPTPET